MKKLFILILAGMMAAPSFAQFSTSRSRSRYNHNDTESYYGLRLGMNIASLSSDNADLDMDSRAGLAFGAVYGFQLANSTPVWLELGAFYSEKGGTMESVPFQMPENKVGFQKVKCRLSYLQVPVVVKYSLDLIDDLYIQPFLGGYMALGLGGKMKYYGEQRSTSSYDAVDRFDGGLRLGCGLEYQMLYAEAGFDFGIANIGDSDFDGDRRQRLRRCPHPFVLHQCWCELLS